MAYGVPPSTSMRRILPSQVVGILGVVLLRGRLAAVAEGDVQVAGSVERELTAVVRDERLLLFEQDLLAVRIGQVRIGRDAEARDDREQGRTAHGGVVDEELAVAGVERVEGQPEQAALAAGDDAAAQIEEGRRSGADRP